MSANNSAADSQKEHGNSVYAALARTLTRSLALYFSRPIRIFRPHKVSGWMFLHGLATEKGVSLSPQFIRELVRKHGLFVVPRHFIPPIAVNAVLGTVLWSTYSETSEFLEGRIKNPLAISLISGAVAGGAQAVVAAPAENVRLVLEGGGTHAGWSSAWKDVFLGSRSNVNISKSESLREARQVRLWMKDVGEMAGRGWNGFSWGLLKDSCGFAIFFSIFELTRQIAADLRMKSDRIVNKYDGESLPHKTLIPRLVHGCSLVGGGVLAGLAYEISTRPFDEARRIVHAQRVSDPSHKTIYAGFRAVMYRAQEDGINPFFRSKPNHEAPNSPDQFSFRHPRLYSLLRVMGRVGPWGAGFLIWEAFGPGLSS